MQKKKKRRGRKNEKKEEEGEKLKERERVFKWSVCGIKW